jgi:pyrroloquinoline quinone biosynthesis protein E
MEGETLAVFEKKSGMTAEFSGAELLRLLSWCRSPGEDEFVRRLFRLGILTDRGTDAPAVLRGYGRQREGRPRALHIDVTDYCPLACPQCYRAGARAEPAGSNGRADAGVCADGNGQAGVSGRTDMSLPGFAALIREAAGLDCFQIAVGGGEPLCHPRIEELIACAGRTEMAVSLTTSGALPPGARLPEKISGLREAGLNHIQVSLNGSTEETNRRSRDGYRQATALMQHLGGCGLSWGVNWTARADNLHELEALCALAADLGADNVNVLRYKPAGNEDYAGAALRGEEERALAARLRRVRGVRIKVDSAYSFLFRLLYGDAPEIAAGCAAGTGFVSVTAAGAFKPCSHLADAFPAKGLRAYLRSRAYLDFLREKASPPGTCRLCRHARTCGGCRAIAPAPETGCGAGMDPASVCPAFQTVTGYSEAQ